MTAIQNNIQQSAIEGGQKERQRGAVRDILLSYVYVLNWIILSSGLIMFNKYILTFYGFPYPIALTLMHMAFGSAVAFVLVKSGMVKQVEIDTDTYLTGVAPISLLFAIVLWLSNATYVYLSVSFTQMLKAFSPVCVYVVGVFFGNEKKKKKKKRKKKKREKKYSQNQKNFKKRLRYRDHLIWQWWRSGFVQLHMVRQTLCRLEQCYKYRQCYWSPFD
eukprot:TRINITY_DN8025_c0_g1_i7.p2 TRINITY_DN8025_c0_g1~~TRINITY_DN8025_c0_g1_i7.p2  ORF type:complete len:255 (-),score=-6.09 TRINITY_DN8025_c0_g1_i7:1500-2153(-)